MIKHIYKIVYLLLAISLFVACDEEERGPVFMPGDSPVLNDPSLGTNMVFDRLNADINMVTFNWGNADFGFQSATSYALQFDVEGNNFIDAFEVASTTDTTVSLSQALLNEKFMAMGVLPDVKTNLEMRVKASVSPEADAIYSTTVKVTASLYASTFPSIYMIGACIGGWDPAKAVELISTGQPYEYTTITKFDGTEGTNFRFFNAPDWGASLGGYNLFTVYPSDLLEPATADDDPNFNFIGTPGWFELLINSKLGSIEMKAIDEPGMYLTGDATHGWGWDEPVTTLNWVAYKVWEGDVTFINGNAFRLFPQKGWDPISYGWNFIVNYNTKYIDIMEGHDDPNWQFVAPSGTYHVKVDLPNLSIEISE